ncbi:MAG TPA: NCS2 family permease [Chlamydiales bacterium]|nr:NCS2 family permease [Chlamydiales bacterium]
MRKEIIAGLSTFFTVGYLILLYPKILSEGGVDFGSALTATILTIVLSTTFLALYAHFPVVLAPGLSIGPYLVYSVILQDHVSWQTAFGIVFWAGVVLLLMSLFKLRQKILLHLPPSIKSAAIAGIGLFLICISLKNLSLFEGHVLTLPNAIVLFGLLLFFTLHYFQISSAFLITTLFCWLIAFPFGLAHWSGLVALPASIHPTLFQLDFLTPLQPLLWGTVLSVILINLFDTSAAITILAKLAHKLDSQGQVKDLDRIVIPDGAGNIVASFLGTGTLTYTLESASGIKAGGRGATTALVSAFCCLTGLFFYPLISSIPLFATAPAMIAIGIFMAQEVRNIRWRDYTESVPAALTLVTIPVTFSIYSGFSFGFISYVFLKAINGQWRQVHPVCWILAFIFAAHLLLNHP